MKKQTFPRATEMFSKWAHKNFKKGEGVMVWESEHMFICSRPRSRIAELEKRKKS